MYERQMYRGIRCDGNKEWCKNWREYDLSVQNSHEELDEFWPEHTKVYNAWAKKSIEELCLMAWKIDAKFEWRLTCAF